MTKTVFLFPLMVLHGIGWYCKDIGWYFTVLYGTSANYRVVHLVISYGEKNHTPTQYNDACHTRKSHVSDSDCTRFHLLFLGENLVMLCQLLLQIQCWQVQKEMHALNYLYRVNLWYRSGTLHRYRCKFKLLLDSTDSRE